MSKEVFCGDFCAHFPLSQDWSLSVSRGARVATIQRATEGNVPVVYVVLASDPRAKDLSARERESKTQEKESLTRRFSRSSRVVSSPSLVPSFASPATRRLRELLLLLPRASRPGHEPVPFVFFFFFFCSIFCFLLLSISAYSFVSDFCSSLNPSSWSGCFAISSFAMRHSRYDLDSILHLFASDFCFCFNVYI